MDDPVWSLDITDLDDDKDWRHLRYFFPYVRKFLFPTAGLALENLLAFPPEKLKLSSEKRDKLQDLSLSRHPRKKESPLEILSSWSVVRWIWSFAKSSEILRDFHFRGKEAEFKKVSLLLFPTGVGLLLIEAMPKEIPKISFVRQFNKNFATIDKLSYGRIKLAELEFKTEENSRKKLLKNIIQENFLGFLPEELIEKGSYALGESFLLYYSVVGKEIENREELEEAFAEFLGESSEVGDLKFSGVNTLGKFDKNGAIVVVGRQKNTGANAQKLLEQWRTIYFDIFLHALYHRLSLLQFSWELSKIDELVENAEKVSLLHWRFLQFTNKAWFGHLTNTDYGNYIWKYWKEVMETERLYEEVKTQLKELDEYLERKQRERGERLVQLLTIIGFPVTFVLGIFSTGFFAVEGLKLSWQVAIKVAFFTTFILMILTMGYLGWFKKSLRILRKGFKNFNFQKPHLPKITKNKDFSC
ncbi:hypothetical protein ciss_05480 [Carboxydothermus islandicus]|uniref:Uncharacterized protein n=1 Tax=Carboxydothermus islandicus TaxID=661089 RepID=A0A1L8D0A3_9THEO|nr:hypothetical protein ciss_05480 [Carboxydothermus islandicus]